MVSPATVYESTGQTGEIIAYGVAMRSGSKMGDRKTLRKVEHTFVVYVDTCSSNISFQNHGHYYGVGSTFAA